MQNKFYKYANSLRLYTKMAIILNFESKSTFLTEDENNHNAKLSEHTPDILERKQTLEDRTQKECQPEVDQTPMTSVQIKREQQRHLRQSLQTHESSQSDSQPPLPPLPPVSALADRVGALVSS